MSPDRISSDRPARREHCPEHATLWLAGQLLASPALGIDEALLAVAVGCGGCDTHAVLQQLDNASIGLFACQDQDSRAQAQRLARILSETLNLTTEHNDPHALLIDDVLISRRGHPLTIACIGAEIARRAGLCGFVCQSPEGWWIALHSAGHTALIGANDTGHPDPTTLQRICPHQIARLTLNLLARDNDEPWSAHARQLTNTLPH